MQLTVHRHRLSRPRSGAWCGSPSQTASLGRIERSTSYAGSMKNRSWSSFWRKGHSPDEAEDLKQAFFEHLLSKNAFEDASGLKVKLRAFLITKLQSFLIDRHRHDVAEKRGGGKVAAMADLSETQTPSRRAGGRQDTRHRLPAPVDGNHRRECDEGSPRGLHQARPRRSFRGAGPFHHWQGRYQPRRTLTKLDRPEGTLKSDISLPPRPLPEPHP